MDGSKVGNETSDKLSQHSIAKTILGSDAALLWRSAIARMATLRSWLSRAFRR
jgi:hypothetical protein